MQNEGDSWNPRKELARKMRSVGKRKVDLQKGRDMGRLSGKRKSKPGQKVWETGMAIKGRYETLPLRESLLSARVTREDLVRVGGNWELNRQPEEHVEKPRAHVKY